MFRENYEVECVSGTTRMQSDLLEAFNKVACEDNWKFPVDAEISLDEFNQALISDAVVHFTGSVPEFRVRGKTVFVRAAGYYNTIGA